MDKTNLDIGIGTTEVQVLKPANVEIRDVEVREIDIKGKKNEKLACFCKHPDKEELVEISQVKFEKRGKLVVTGLWLNKDKNGLLIKNTAIAVLLTYFGCKSPKDLIGKVLLTTQDEKGYLCFKAY